MCECPFCTQIQSSSEHLSNVAVTAQETNGRFAGVDRVYCGVADVISNLNEGVSGDNASILCLYLFFWALRPRCDVYSSMSIG